MSPRVCPGFSVRFSLAFALLLLPLALLALDPAKSIHQFNVQSWTRQDGLPSDKINSVIQTADGYIWFGTQRGLVRFDGIEFKEVPIDFPEIAGTEVSKLVPAKSGMWLAINQGGFAHYSGRTFSSAGDPNWPHATLHARALLETRDGALWMGSNRGLGKWVPTQPAENLWSAEVLNIRALCEDRTGRIWAGTEDRGLFVFEKGKFTAIADPTLAQEQIMALAAGPDGNIWVACSKGLRCYNAAGVRQEIAAPPNLVGTILALLFDRHGTLWVGTSGRGLARYRDGVFTMLHRVDGLGSEFVTSLCEDNEGNLWVGTRDGLSQLSDIRFPIFSGNEGLNEGTGHTVTASRRGGVWLTTSTGYSYFDGKIGRRLEGKALPNNPYIKLGFEARNGDFYVVDGDRTVSVMRNDAIIASYRNDTWPEAITEDDEGIVLAMGSQLSRLRDGAIVPYVFKDGKGPDVAYFDSLMTASDGAIWAGCYNGLVRIKNGEFKQWGVREGLSGARVHFVFEDSDGSIWAAMPTGLARVKDDVVRNITVANGLPADRVFAIVADTLGYFWLTTSRGLVRVARLNLNEFADGVAPRVNCELFDGLESVKFSDRTEQGYSGARTADGRIWFPNPQGMVMIDPARYFKNQVPPPVHVQQVRVDGKEIVPAAGGVLQLTGKRIEFYFTALSFIAPKNVQLRYQLEGFDAGWIDAANRRSVLYNGLPPGRYTFRVQAGNADGVWNQTGDSLVLELPPQFYQTAWFYGACILVTTLGLFGVHRTRVRLLEKQQAKLRAQNDLLEAKVSARTDELANFVSLLKATIESTADGILAIHQSGDIVSFNTQFASMWGLRPDEMQGKRASDAVAAMAAQVKDPAQLLARSKELEANPETDAFDVLTLADGRIIERYCKPQRIKGKCVGVVFNFRDITARKRAEAELEKVNRQLLESSRHAGMAEIATNVLHNVGNVLNSVNVSATLVMDRAREAKGAKLPRLAAMLKEHANDLGGFLRTDAKGQKIPEYLEVLGRELDTQREGIVSELTQLCKNVEHIKEIVAMQQNYTRVSGVSERISVKELVEDALRINSAALERHGVQIVREYKAEPTITVDRHKAVQILVNLIGNAKNACEESPVPTKQVAVVVALTNGHIGIAVRDNGVGIAPENLTRIFEHGFTTRKNGHGFGLHSGALAAKELQGALRAESEGVGKGACFTLELPHR